MSEQEKTIEVLELSDGMSAELAKDSRGTAKRLLQKLSDQWGKLAAILFATVMSCGFSVAAPMVIGRAINLLLAGIRRGQIDFGAIGLTVLALLAVYGLSAIFSYLQQYMMAGVTQTLTLNLREELNEKLSKLPLRFYDQHKKGDVLSRITNDLERVSDTLQNSVVQFLTSIVTILGALVLMLVISPVLTLIAIATIVFSTGATLLLSKKSQRYYRENQRATGELNGQIEELFTGQTEVKAFHKEAESIRTVEALNERLCQAGWKAQFVSYAVTPAIRFFNQLGYVTIAVLGGIFVTQGRVSLGGIQAFFQYVSQVSEPLTMASYILNVMQGAIASAERVFELMDAPEESADPAQPAELAKPQGAVSFEHVRFGYEENQVLMQDLNLQLHPGDKIAIVGPTGAGKTTLINLLMRFYETQGGRITIDGVDIRALARGKLREMFGMVLQDTWLFGGTIEKNIAYGRTGATAEEVRQAAVAARADHFIRTLPEGYQTILEEEGTNLSQGQRQLLTIARAILADPQILILDEATSSVDTRTEVEIQKAMDDLMKGRTSFVIAHRLSTIRDADVILVMKNGSIVEQGNHRTLLKQNGFYAELYNSQFAS